MFLYTNKSWRCFIFYEGMWLVLVISIVSCWCSTHINEYPADIKQQIYNSTFLEHSEIINEGGNQDVLQSTNTSNINIPDANINNLTISSTSLHSIEDTIETTSLFFTNTSILDEYNSTDYNTSNCNLTNEEYLTSNNGDQTTTAKATTTNFIFNIGIITGISVLVIIIAILIGVLSFVLYRHFSWNRPQTLSDKFSNDESTGYIDDTAFRENSEEMYSLDNDSFLNSLEAMTIQNYWTDHKHTKL